MSEPTVSAGFARALLDFAVAKGADRGALCTRAGLDPETLGDPDDRVPFDKYVALMRVGKELSGDPALALHFGEEVNMSEMSVLGLIGQACETMLDAFVQLNRYVKLVVDVDEGTADRFQMRNERGGLWFVDTRADPNDFPELTESAFAQFAASSRRIAGARRLAKVVHLTHSDPGYRAEYERITGTTVIFDSDWNAAQLDPEMLTLKVQTLPRYAFAVLSEHGDALLKELDASKTVKGRVESLLVPMLHTGDIGMDTIAAKLAMSRQTLLRKLKTEGTTFEKLLDELRHRMALHYLSGKKVSVNQTAYLVGFSEPAAFSRAFKRWTGASPRNLRAKLAETS